MINIYPYPIPKAIGIMRNPRTAAEKCLVTYHTRVKFAGPFGEEPTLQATPEARNVLPSSFLHMAGSGYIVLEGHGSHESPAGAEEQR